MTSFKPGISITEFSSYKLSLVTGGEEGLAEDKEGSKVTGWKNVARVHMKDAKSPRSKLQ